MDFFKKKHLQQEGSSALLRRVKKIIRCHGLLKPNDRIIVGVSGGADSLGLLHILHEMDWKLQLIAVYIDHGLRPEEAAEERKTIKDCCQRLNVRFIAESVNVQQYITRKKCSPEEGARILRYNALEKIRADQKASAIAIAHTSDDQVEEFFIRLIRGSSLKGLAGMKLKRDLIIRPLLHECKTTLIHYLAERDVSFCQDSSNDDRRFLRNRVRLDLLPKLEKEFNPSIRQTILQNMDILGQDDNFLEEVSCKAFEECVECDVEDFQLVLSPVRLIGYHQAIQRRIIEKCFWRMRIKPGYLQIRSLLNFSQKAENSRELHLADGVRAAKSLNQIVLSRPLKEGHLRGSIPVDTFKPFHIAEPGSYTIRGTGSILTLSVSLVRTVNNSNRKCLYLDMETVAFPLLLRPPIAGERFRPYNAPGKKKISRYLGEKKIEVKRRAGYPVLVSDNKVIAIPGLQIAHEVRVTGTTRKILEIELGDNGSNEIKDQG